MELFDKAFQEYRRKDWPREVIRFNTKAMKRLLEQEYRIEVVTELYFDDEEAGLAYNNWTDEYSEGTWGLSQKNLEDMTHDAVRRFSHLTRRQKQKVIPRAYKEIRSDNVIMVYLFMRDKEYCDYAIFFVKKERKC